MDLSSGRVLRASDTPDDPNYRAVLVDHAGQYAPAPGRAGGTCGSVAPAPAPAPGRAGGPCGSVCAPALALLGHYDH